MCTKPLHAFGDKWGPICCPENRFNPSPFYHQYICVPDGKGRKICGGQDRGGGAFGAGKPSDDKYDDRQCKAADDTKSVEQCLLKEITDTNRPPYWLVGGGGRNAGAYNCQQWADKKMKDCQQQCKAK